MGYREIVELFLRELEDMKERKNRERVIKEKSFLVISAWLKIMKSDMPSVSDLPGKKLFFASRDFEHFDRVRMEMQIILERHIYRIVERDRKNVADEVQVYAQAIMNFLPDGKRPRYDAKLFARQMEFIFKLEDIYHASFVWREKWTVLLQLFSSDPFLTRIMQRRNKIDCPIAHQVLTKHHFERRGLNAIFAALT